ncbi:uncharacterized protein [Parasteatoda tepidariorum]|uniref:uncharacterized protein isoform X2 n=1 Tax=Parasteatoda tepidariorum TaxID=114398 RepID=UPI001C726B50|nr:uncharacterized protein LOC122270632 isoform X2 [Parasteatoda tepidariorum]
MAAMRTKYRVVTDETMVESCPAEDPSISCCGPHVFTSVLLGVLACVLMTGGVFLAFHRWDPLWLIVSGVGVILVLIGSILHCCRPSGGGGTKGCCPPDHHLHHNHLLLNGGSLTEQLLPLSNARSVSQLSLNMLPGYFPPMVTTYGIEQHSAVVQNINRQQQPGKNLILLSLPGNTPQANIQNLVATVYQLDGSVLAETSNSSTDPPATTPPVSSSAVQSNIPVLKNAEVQTCVAWPVPNAAINNASPSTSNDCSPISTQTDDVAINLMDCLPDDPICDTSFASNESPAILVDISEDSEPESITNNIPDTTSLSYTQLPIEPSEVLVAEMLTSSNSLQTAAAENVEESPPTIHRTTDSPPVPVVESTDVVQNNLSSSLVDVVQNDLSSSLVDVIQNDNSSSLVDVDSLGRSSPPPSYEDVQGETSVGGVFGLAYGTL